MNPIYHKPTMWYDIEVRTRSGWRKSKNNCFFIEPDWNETFQDALKEMKEFAREQGISLRNIRLRRNHNGPDCLIDGTRTLYEYDQNGNIVLPPGCQSVSKRQRTTTDFVKTENCTLEDVKKAVIKAAHKLTVPYVVELLKTVAGAEKVSLVPPDKYDAVARALNTAMKLPNDESI